MLEPIRDDNGKLLFKWDSEKLAMEIQKNNTPTYSPKMIADGLMEDGICTPSGGEKWYPSTVASILENEEYAGDLLMQKWYVEDYLTHKCVKNTGDRPQYFVEDDHECCSYVNTFAPPQKARKLGVSWNFAVAHPS